MSLYDSAKAVMSGEYSRRRGYLIRAIHIYNGLAITGTLSIWAFIVKWDHLIKVNNGSGELFSSQQLFSIEVAWASAISSLLIGLCRLYVRYIDHAIIRLYPAIYICEHALMPSKICMKPPQKIYAISKVKNNEDFDWVKVCYVCFGHRGHLWIDTIATLAILLFTGINVYITYYMKISFPLFGSSHSIGWLLTGNIIGFLFIFYGWIWWCFQEVDWPVPIGCKELHEKSTV